MNDKKTSVRTLTMLALLVAMSIVFSRVLSISTGFVRFNLGSLPVLLAAGHVCIVEAEVLAGDLLDPIQNHGRSVIIVICHYDIVASVQQFDAGVAADVAGTAGNQNCHSRVPLSHSISCFFFLRRALPGLLKEYRFLPPTARGAFFIQIYFCCIFVQYTFD